MKKSLWAVGAITAVAAASLAGCGGGSDGGGGFGGYPIVPPPAPAPGTEPPPPPPPPPPSSSTSSADCTNEADYHAGTVLDYEGRTTSPGEPDVASHIVRTTGERESFAGANPVPFVLPSVTSGEVVINSRFYSDLIGGNVVQYGNLVTTSTPTTSATNSGTYEPPPAYPVDMQAGESVSRSYNSKLVVVGTGENGTTTTTVVVALTTELTYVGRETLQTAMGSFNVCRFSTKVSSTPESGVTTLVNSESWIAAEGPYRGQQLKSHILPDSVGGRETTFEVNKISYTPK